MPACTIPYSMKQKTVNVLTFDVEEWYVYQLFAKGGPAYYRPCLSALFNELLDFLDEQQTRATFFCLGEVARSEPWVLRELVARGHELGCHSDRHLRVEQLSRSAFRDDTRRAIDSLAQAAGCSIDFYRAPAFSITAATPWAFEVLAAEGIRCDCSLFPGKRRGGGLPSLSQGRPFRIETASGCLYELPMSFHKLGLWKVFFSGGGYFRFFPYAMVKKLMAVGSYNMTYFHLRDFDRSQKRVFSMNYFQSYYGIGHAFDKFQHLVRDFHFVTVGEALQVFVAEEEGCVSSDAYVQTLSEAGF